METQKIDLKNESNRLGTFVGWPVSFIISPKSLAAAGFYYTTHTDKVKCAFCDICICRWEFGDNAFDEHKRHNPNCSFILSEDCGNIPIIDGIQLRGDFIETQKETGEPIDIQGLGIRSHQVTFHLKYNTYSARLKSFKGWQNVSQDPKILANAGFFFTRSNDEVRCYHCDGGLQNWERTDNPWVEHAKWFPNCGFLNLVKGNKFLDRNLMERFNALLSRADLPSSSSQEASVYPGGASSNGTRSAPISSSIDDFQISELMVLPEALTALQLGLQPDQIRQAMRNNMQDIGRPFRRPEEFIRQILSENYSHLPEIEAGTIEDMIRREENSFRTIWHPPPLSDDNETESSSSASEHSEHSYDIEVLVHGYEINDDEASEISDENNETNTNNEISKTNDIAIVADGTQTSQSSEINVKEKVKLEETELSDLQEENRRLKEARLCKICLDQELGVVMLPCAHLVACSSCASSLPDCPLCRQTIKATVRTFLS